MLIHGTGFRGAMVVRVGEWTSPGISGGGMEFVGSGGEDPRSPTTCTRAPTAISTTRASPLPGGAGELPAEPGDRGCRWNEVVNQILDQPGAGSPGDPGDGTTRSGQASPLPLPPGLPGGAGLPEPCRFDLSSTSSSSQTGARGSHAPPVGGLIYRDVIPRGKSSSGRFTSGIQVSDAEPRALLRDENEQVAGGVRGDGPGGTGSGMTRVDGDPQRGAAYLPGRTGRISRVPAPRPP